MADISLLSTASPFRLQPLGLQVVGTPTYEQWEAYGGVLWMLGQAAQWAIGDWIEYGEATYGEKYTQAEALTKRSPDSLMNLAYVARRFPISRRRENLGWSFHAEVASLTLGRGESKDADSSRSPTGTSQRPSPVPGSPPPSRWFPTGRRRG